MVLCLAVTLGSSILGFTKSFFLEKPSLQNQALSHPSDPESEESQPATQLGERARSVSQKNDVLSEANDIDQSIVHNRTSRDLVLECYEKGVWRFDKCRNQFVSEIKCLVSHKVCYKSQERCEAVLGFRNTSFIGKCFALTLGCQCAASQLSG